MAHTLNIYVTDETYRNLRGIAFALGESMSKVVAELIEEAPDPKGSWYEAWLKEQKEGGK